MNIASTKMGAVEYRIDGTGARTVLILHGGHMSASTHLGEDYFLARGYRVLVVSRPGYGKTPLPTDSGPEPFVSVLKELLDQLAIHKLVLMGISAGGRTAMRFAVAYPFMIEKLILQSSTSFAPWPDLKTRIAAQIAFNPVTERYTWKAMRYFLKKNRRAALKLMISNMTTLNINEVMQGYTETQLKGLSQIFSHSGSGQGFMNDIKESGGDASTVNVPTLIIHSKYDKSVPLSHPKLLAKQIKNSQLYFSEAESHMIWFSHDYDQIKSVMDAFLNADQSARLATKLQS